MERSTQQIQKLKDERAENEAKIEQLTHQNERLKAREQYLAKNKIKADHEKEIQKFQMAARKLKPHFCDGKLPITKWRNELSALEQEYEKNKAEINTIKSETRSLTQISIAVKSALQDDEKKYREVQQQRYTAAEDPHQVQRRRFYPSRRTDEKGNGVTEVTPHTPENLSIFR